MDGSVVAVNRSESHTRTKFGATSIRLVEGFGVEGDAHGGARVQHLSRIKRDASKPNLRQVHLIYAELHDELNAAGFDVSPGLMGENITTRGLDILALPAGSRLHIGGSAIIEVTGLRDPCWQLDELRPGLMAATLERDEDGELVRKAGIMAVVTASGDVAPGDAIRVVEPAVPHHSLQPV